MSPVIPLIIGVVVALAATVYACIMIVPEKKRSTLNSPILVFIHDLCNFKALLLEKILRVLYVFLTCLCVACGFFMLFTFNRAMVGGLLLIIFGPIIVRILFESFMLAIIAVKNIIQINQKLGGTDAPLPRAPEKPFFAPKAPAAPAAPAYTQPAPAVPAAPVFTHPAPVAPAAPACVEPEQPAPAAPACEQPEPAAAICEQPDLFDPFAQSQAQPAPDAPAVEPKYVYCTECGTRYDKNAGGCPNGCVPEA